MHRTQLLLEEWQYEALRGRAERDSKSISALVREIFSAHLEQPGHQKLDLMEGIAEGPPDLGKNHERYLYGKD